VRYLYKSEGHTIPQRLLFVPLKETVLFPYVVAPVFFQAEEAVVILNKVILENSLIGCVAQRDPSLVNPQPKDLLCDLKGLG
jgi:ATP-dependent Lon protease